MQQIEYVYHKTCNMIMRAYMLYVHAMFIAYVFTSSQIVLLGAQCVIYL